MKFIPLLIASVLIVFAGKSQVKQLKIYNQIVESADKIVVYGLEKKSYKTTKIISELSELHTAKNLLRINIKPKAKRKQVYHITQKIELYENKLVIGVYYILDNKEYPVVYFKSKKVSFYFGLTYGIGMGF